MVLFARKKKQEAQRFLLKVVNTNCPAVTAPAEGRRHNHRVNLTLVVLVVPVVDGRPAADRAFSAITKDFSNAGFSLALNAPVTTEELIVGFPSGSELTFVRGKAAHLDRMGGGFYQLGVDLIELISVGDHPQLGSLRL
jgi:hypothetical protein